MDKLQGGNLIQKPSPSSPPPVDWAVNSQDRDEGSARSYAQAARPPVERLAREAAAGLGWSGTVHVDKCEIQTHELSTTVRLRLVAGHSARTVWVKLPRIKQDNVELVVDRIHTEFSILEALSDHFRDRPDLGVVTPLAIVDEPLALITEEVPGETFQKVLVRGARLPASLWRQSRLLTLSRRCGEWLRRFHDTTRIAKGEAKWDETLSYCQRRLDLLVAEPQTGIDAKTGESIRASLVRCIDEARALPGTVCGRHNDFAGHNMIVTEGDGISVLDFSMFDQDSPAFDYFSFIHKMDVLRHDPFISASICDQLVRAFESGYGSAPKDVRAARDIVYCRLNIAKLLTLACEPQSNPVTRHLGRRLQIAYRKWLREFAGDRG